MRVPGSLINDSNIAVRSAARMMSGALSRAGRPEHPAEADAIDASLIALYQSAPDVHEKTELLSALGNSAGPSVIPAIEEALRDSNVPIRSAAARALRLAPALTLIAFSPTSSPLTPTLRSAPTPSSPLGSGIRCHRRLSTPCCTPPAPTKPGIFAAMR
jgi:hypothetical protein